MASITGYNIYRYTDAGDPKLSFDIVILENESNSASYPEDEISYRIVPTNVKIPFASNNTGHAAITTLQKNPKANLQMETINVGSEKHLRWTFKGNSADMVTLGAPLAATDTSSLTVAYPVIMHHNGKYYANNLSVIVFYNRNIENLRGIQRNNHYPNTYSSILVNQDKDVDPIYPWYGDDLACVYTTDQYYTLQDYLNWYPEYDFSPNDITSFIEPILGVSKKRDTDDPNDGGGSSKPNGGGGPSDIGGDTNEDDGLPTISALDSGLLTAYNPTVGELQSLGKFLWSDNFNLDSFKKLFNDPFDTLLGLSIVPINPHTSGSKNIMFGNMDSGVSAPVVSSQWVTKDMGSVTLNEVWKGALDYSPSTSASIYLPFIGMRQLNINDVMGSTLHLIYKFDVLTGGCVAQIYVNHNHLGNKDGGFSWNTNQGLLYEFMGQCAVNIPLASQDFTNTIRSAVSAVGMVAGTSASIATGNPVLGVATATMASANLGMQANTPTVERSGHLSGSCSLLGYYQPFLVVTRPHQCKPSRYYALRGIPSQVYTSKLSNCTGFTQITANNNIHVIGAEDSELAEIQNLLVSGVYFPDKKR